MRKTHSIIYAGYPRPNAPVYADSSTRGAQGRVLRMSVIRCDNEALRLENVCYHYGSADAPINILTNISLCIARGETCAITGPSGAGKSTLMHLIGLLERPKAGNLFIAGQETSHASANVRAQLRNEHIGFIFQAFNLLPRLTTLENVALPLLYRGEKKRAALLKAADWLDQVGLAERVHHRPGELSGGQCQRVAIARALCGNPSLLLADEPTGNLDDETGNKIVEVLLEKNRTHRTTLVIVTHDKVLASRMNRQFYVTNGGIQE